MVAIADEVDITSNFSYTWNGAESISTNKEQVVVYNAVQWGGMSAWLGGVDWSDYDALVMEFAMIEGDNGQWSTVLGIDLIELVGEEDD